MITRISKIKGYNNILGGRDLANIFKDGHVYQLSKIMGEIVVKDLGVHANRKGLTVDRGHKFSTIMLDGSYLLTEKEYEAQERAEQEDEDF